MIRFLDSLALAQAKLHSKRLLLMSIVAISSLLFAILYCVVIVSSGITKSASSYTQKALDGKYLVKSTPILPQNIFGPSRIDVSEDVIAELNTMQADYINRQKALSITLKIPFDEKAIPQILLPNPYTTNNASGKKSVMINTDSPVFQLYLQKLQTDYVKIAKNKLTDLQEVAKRYGAQAFHQNIQATVSFQTMHFLKDGKEDISKLSEPSPSNSDFSTYGYMTSSVRNSNYSFVDDSLVKRFILPENDARKSNKTAIPVVITEKEAVDLFGERLRLNAKPEKAPEQINWMKTLQEKVNGLTYVSCYRNQADITRITKAAGILTEIEQHKNDKTYAQPELIYNLPTDICGDLSIKQDTRTVTEKNEEAKQTDISKKLGTYQDPIRQLFTFQVVGIMPTTPGQTSITSLPSFLSDLLGAHYGAGAIIPLQHYETLPSEARYEAILRGNSTSYSLKSLEDAGIGETIVTFDSLDNARRFIKDQGCATQDDCGKPFTLEAYGSNYLLMDDLQAIIMKLLGYGLLGGAGIATIIIWFMMARVIVDSRRETSVFRAIGAKRRDIVSIYLLYSGAVAFRIILLALLLGISAALTIQILFASDITDYALVSYGIFHNMEPFRLIDFTSPFMLWITIGVVGVSLVAVIPPLARNVRRNPMKDMREE